MTETHTFNPTERLRRVQGGALYMDVADRKLWLHTMTEHALAGAYSYIINTECHTLTDRLAVFRAEVTIADSEGTVIRRSSGWGSETPQDFGDFIEKAETKALGRALANAGFGTANAEPEGVIVDAPRGGDGGFVQHNGNGRSSANGSGPAAAPTVANPGGSPTQKQVDFFVRLCTEKHIDPNDFCQEKVGSPLDGVTRGQMSRLIDDIKNAADASVEEPF